MSGITIKSKTLRRHLRNQTPLLQQLIASGRNDAYVLSLLLTESYFRNARQRVREYVVWTVLRFLRKEEAGFVSVGIAQIQVRHWEKYRHLVNTSFLEQLKLFWNPRSNYDVCHVHLRDYLNGADPSLVSAAAGHVGEAQVYYLSILAQCYSWLLPSFHNRLMNADPKSQ